jgi:hypothetical protein
MDKKMQKPLNLSQTQAVYAPTFVPASIVRELGWGNNRYLQLKRSGIPARLVAPPNQGPMVVYQQTSLVS